jgi:uncharacterized protein (DUF58 family)
LEVKVFPDAGKYGSLLARVRGQMGARLMRQVGKGREFEKLREYTAGDGFDEIHWKATARRRVPITKVYQTERMQEIYAVIDVSRLMARRFGDSSALDEYLRVALLLGHRRRAARRPLRRHSLPPRSLAFPSGAQRQSALRRLPRRRCSTRNRSPSRPTSSSSPPSCEPASRNVPCSFC